MRAARRQEVHFVLALDGVVVALERKVVDAGADERYRARLMRTEPGLIAGVRAASRSADRRARDALSACSVSSCFI